jgi:protein-tyrosine phosphatase
MSHDHLLHTPITNPIDPQLVAEITSHPPWVSIPGTFNSRDLGGSVKPGFIYRSGTLENVRDEGLERMRELRIGVVVDLRSGRERARDPESEIWRAFEGIWFEEGEGEGEKRGETSVSCLEVLMARMGC